MPGMPHELMVEVFREQPRLAVDLLRDQLHLELPPFADIQVTDSTLAQVNLIADLSVLLTEKGEPVFAFAVEVQLQPDPEKAYAWPLYAMSLRSRHRSPAGVVVVAPNARTAAWAREPIDIGFGVRFAPMVIGPESIPKVTSAAEAQAMPALAFLSALAWGRDDESGEPVARAALLAVGQALGGDRVAGQTSGRAGSSAADLARETLYRKKYVTMILQAVTPAVRKKLEAEMSVNWEELFEETFGEAAAKGRAEGEARGRAEGEARGRAEGEAQALIRVLSARGLAVSDEERQRILACQDTDLLARWIERSVIVARTEEIFGGDS